MKNKKLIKIFQFLNKERNKEFPFEWTALNYPDLISDDKYLSVEDLDLGGKNLTEIPKFLLKCKNLTFLYLSDNLISKLENLENCIKLKRLFLSHNQISVIENLDNCKKLEYLYLANNRIPWSNFNEFKQNNPQITVYS